MIEIWAGGLALLLLAAVFLLFPRLFLRQRRELSQQQSNRDWFRRRSEEVAEDPELLQDARLRVLEDASQGVDGEPPGTVAGGLRPAYLLVPLALLAAVLYWTLGAAADVHLARSLQSLSADSTEADYRRLMLQVEDRAAQRPDNLHYRAMLGRFYMNEGDYGRARVLYLELAEQAPGDAGALAMAAQAAFLAAGRVLDADSQVLAERALSIDPHQRTALGLLGMSAFEAGQYQAAIGYWRRLLVTEDPRSQSAQMIQGVIARAESALAQPGPAQAAAAVATTESASAGGLGVTVRLELPAESAAGAGDTVFVFARNPATGSRMPVAVQRLTAGELPVTLRLDDARSMAGQKISELAAVQLVARVSPSGKPGEEFATFKGQLGPISPDDGETTHRLLLQPAVGGESAGDET